MQVKHRASLIALSVIAGPGVVTGCGGDSDEGGDVSTGIARDKQLGELSQSEASQACERLRAGFAEVVSRDVRVRTFCTLFSASATNSAADCATLRDGCIEQANDSNSRVAMTVDMNPIDFDCSDGAALSACNASVGQLETCFNDTLDSLEAALRAMTCDNAPTIDPTDLDSVPEMLFQPAASCEQVDCPDAPFGSADGE